MTRRKSKLSILGWFYQSIGFVLGMTPPSRRTLRKQYNRRVKPLLSTKKMKVSSWNNNHSLGCSDIAEDRLSEDDQQRIVCILVENQQVAEMMQDFLMKYSSILREKSRIMELQELVKFIQSTTSIVHQDASTMTCTDQMYRSRINCTNLVNQPENTCRLKALELIRIFIEKNEEEFCRYLIKEEHLCQEKTSAIFQMIQQLIKVIYRSEHLQKQRVL